MYHFCAKTEDHHVPSHSVLNVQKSDVGGWLPNSTSSTKKDMWSCCSWFSDSTEGLGGIFEPETSNTLNYKYVAEYSKWEGNKTSASFPTLTSVIRTYKTTPTSGGWEGSFTSFCMQQHAHMYNNFWIKTMDLSAKAKPSE